MSTIEAGRTDFPPSKTEKKKISIFLPVYNETERRTGDKPAGYYYEKTIADYLSVLDNNFSRDEWNMSIVDDGSKTSDSADLARKNGLRVITYDTPGNRGRGAAYQKGFLELSKSAQVIGAYDADGSYPPATIIDHYEAIEAGHDMAISFRPNSIDQNDGILRAAAHGILRTAREKLAYTGLKDTQAGAFAVSDQAAEYLFDRPDIMSGWAANHQIARIAVLSGMQIAQIEQTIEPRGDSRVGGGILQLMKSGGQMIADSYAIGKEYSPKSQLNKSWVEFTASY